MVSRCSFARGLERIVCDQERLVQGLAGTEYSHMLCHVSNISTSIHLPLYVASSWLLILFILYSISSRGFEVNNAV